MQFKIFILHVVLFSMDDNEAKMFEVKYEHNQKKNSGAITDRSNDILV